MIEDCACGFEPDCDAVPDVYTEKMVMARKEHVCCECGDKIATGEIYQRAWGIWRSGPATYKTCRLCAKIRDDFCQEGWCFETLREALWECLELEL